MTIDQKSVAAKALRPGRYRLDAGASTVRFSARKFGLFTIRGTMDVREGEFVVTDPVADSTLRAVLAADTFATPMTKRDEHVKSEKLLDVERYPTIAFESARVVDRGGLLTVEGQLTVHGQTHPARLVIEQAWESAGVGHVRARTQVDRTKFGVTALRAAASATLHLDIEAVGVRVGD